MLLFSTALNFSTAWALCFEVRMWKISLFSEELCSITIAMIIQTCDNWFHWHLPKVLGSLSQFSAIIWDSIVNFQNWLKFFLLIHLLEMLLLFKILTPPLFLLLFTDSKVLLPFAALDFAVMDDDGFPELDNNDTYSWRYHYHPILENHYHPRQQIQDSKIQGSKRKQNLGICE